MVKQLPQPPEAQQENQQPNKDQIPAPDKDKKQRRLSLSGSIRSFGKGVGNLAGVRKKIEKPNEAHAEQGQPILEPPAVEAEQLIVPPPAYFTLQATQPLPEGWINQVAVANLLPSSSPAKPAVVLKQSTYARLENTINKQGEMISGRDDTIRTQVGIINQRDEELRKYDPILDLHRAITNFEKFIGYQEAKGKGKNTLKGGQADKDKAQFVSALRNLARTLETDMTSKAYFNQQEIRKTAGAIAAATVTMLNNMQKEIENAKPGTLEQKKLKAIVDEYQKHYRQVPGWKEFGTRLGGIIFAALAFIASIPLIVVGGLRANIDIARQSYKGVTGDLEARRAAVKLSHAAQILFPKPKGNVKPQVEVEKQPVLKMGGKK